MISLCDGFDSSWHSVNVALSYFLFPWRSRMNQACCISANNFITFFSLLLSVSLCVCFGIEKRDGIVTIESLSFTSRHGFLFHSFYGFAMLFGFQHYKRNHRYVSHSYSYTKKTLAQIQPGLLFFSSFLYLLTSLAACLFLHFDSLWMSLLRESREFVCVLVRTLIFIFDRTSKAYSQHQKFW